MKLNLDKPIIQLNGQAIKGETAARALASVIQVANTISGISPARAMEIARKLWENGSVDVEKSEFIKLEDFVESHGQLTIVAKEAIMKGMEESDSELKSE